MDFFFLLPSTARKCCWVTDVKWIPQLELFVSKEFLEKIESHATEARLWKLLLLIKFLSISLMKFSMLWWFALFLTWKLLLNVCSYEGKYLHFQFNFGNDLVADMVWLVKFYVWRQKRHLRHLMKLICWAFYAFISPINLKNLAIILFQHNKTKVKFM